MQGQQVLASVSQVVCTVASVSQCPPPPPPFRAGTLFSVLFPGAASTFPWAFVVSGLPPGKGSLPSLTPRWLSSGAEGKFPQRVPGRSLCAGGSCWLCWLCQYWSARQGHGAWCCGENWGCAWQRSGPLGVVGPVRSGRRASRQGHNRQHAQVGKCLQEQQVRGGVRLVLASTLVPSTLS